MRGIKITDEPLCVRGGSSVIYVKNQVREVSYVGLFLHFLKFLFYLEHLRDVVGVKLVVAGGVLQDGADPCAAASGAERNDRSMTTPVRLRNFFMSDRFLRTERGLALPALGRKGFDWLIFKVKLPIAKLSQRSREVNHGNQ